MTAVSQNQVYVPGRLALAIIRAADQYVSRHPATWRRLAEIEAADDRAHHEKEKDRDE